MYWTHKRKISLAVHAALALLLLAWSLTSGLHFWEFAFKDPIYAYGSLIIIDGLALLGFAMHLYRIQSPLVHARHALPLVSAVPLVFDMHTQFQHFGDYRTWVFTIGITGLLVALSFIVWGAIEKLFIPPLEAAREYAQSQMEALHTRSAQLQVMQESADTFVHMHQQRASAAALPALPAASYARLAAHPEPVRMDTQRLPASMQDTNAAMHNADAGMQPDAEPIVHQDAQVQNADVHMCIKCGATVDSVKARAASGRWGCAACKNK